MLPMGEEIRSEDAFRPDAAGYDLTGTRYLETDKLGGLIRLARTRPVRLLLVLDSQPAQCLFRVFPGLLYRPAAGLPDEWVLDFAR